MTLFNDYLAEEDFSMTIEEQLHILGGSNYVDPEDDGDNTNKCNNCEKCNRCTDNCSI
ncbi:MAG: hypothetical protein IJ413_10840 [Bacteroides sp.]|nr:hypothetical protein [Bacteroides sp.]